MSGSRLQYLCICFCLLVAGIAMTGCGLGTLAPNSATTAEPSVSSPPMRGSVWGGHAPLVGAKIYVLSPSQTANYGASTSLMTAGCTGCSEDSGGYYYLTSDATGSFNLTGNYTCTTNKAVYIVGVGGSPTFPSASNVFTLSQVVVSNLAGSGSTETATYTFTTTTTENMYIGESVALTNLSSSSNGNIQYVDQTATVISTNLTTTTFAITAIDASGGIAAGTYALQSGTATAAPTNNPAAVNMAVLGMCPSSGTFNGSISYVYMNEVSTVASAYAMAAFGTDAFHIGVNTQGPENTDRAAYVLNGLKQAMNNATLLYDIQGGEVSTTYAGEGHIARTTTPEGNGTVPQSELDTLGNILAACVDSSNGYGTNSTGGTESPACTTLFQTATSNGVPVTSNGSTTATDISFAAFNIAHYPAGVASSTFVKTLYALPTGNVPFTPNLTTQPNDFSVLLTFIVPSAKGGTTSVIDGPQVLAIDGGNYIGVSDDEALSEAVWVGSYYTRPAKLFADGNPDFTTNTTMANYDNDQRSMTFDASNNVWMTFGTYSIMDEFSSTGSLIASFQGSGNDALSYPEAASFDPSGNIYISNYSGTDVIKLNSSLQNVNGAGTVTTTAFSAASCIGSYAPVNAIDPAGNIYTVAQSNSSNAGQLCVLSASSGASLYTATGYSATVTNNEDTGPNYFAIGPSGTSGTWAAWAAGASNTVKEYIYGNTSTSLTLTGGGLNYPCSTAIDGAGNIWEGNSGNSSISEFQYVSSTSYTALSPASTSGTIANNTGGFGPLNIASDCANPAIDRAGNLWIAYQGYTDTAPGNVYEYIGIAAPTVTPVSYATKNSVLGKRPY